jgi:hypothetical protein
MRASLRLAVLLPALICLPLLALGQGADKGDKGMSDEAKTRKKMLDGKYLQGVFTDVSDDGDDKIALLKAEYEVKKANAEGQKKYNELYNQFRRERDKNRQKDLYNQLLAAAAGTYDVEKVPFEFKIKITGTTKIRRAEPPPKDPDNPKAKYTAAELSKLKGPGGLPGYPCELSDIKYGETTIQVTIDRGKDKGKTPAKTDTKTDKADKDKADKDKSDKDKDKDKDADEVYMATLIMIPPPPKEMPGNPFIGK